MADSDLLTINDWVDPELEPQIKHIAEVWQESMRKMEEATNASMKNSAAALKTSGLPETTEQYKKHNATVKQAVELNEQEYAAKYKIQQANKAIMDSVKAMDSAYKQASVNNEKLRQTAKDLGIQYGITSKQFMEAQKAFLESNNKLKTVDESLGNYSRNVGNYTNSIRKWGQGLAGITGLLRIAGEALGMNTEALGALTAAHHLAREGTRDLQHTLDLNTESVKGNSAAFEMNTVATEAQTAANEEVIVSNEAVGLSWMASLGPLVAIAGAVAAVIGVYEIMSISNKKSIAEMKERSEAIDGTIIEDKALRDSYNENVIAMQALSDEYKVLTGEMTEAEAASNKLALGLTRDIKNINNEAAEQMQKTGGVWDFVKDLFGSGVMGLSQTEEMAKIEAKRQELIKEAADQEQAHQLLNIERTQKAHDKADAESLEKEREASLLHIRDTQKRELYELEAKRDFDVKMEKMSTDDEIEKNDKLKGIEATYQAQRKEIIRKAQEEELQMVLNANIEQAKLGKNKFAIENEEYEKARYDLEQSLEKRGATESEKLKERENLTLQHWENIRKIVRDNEDIISDIQRKQNETVRGSIDKLFFDSIQKYNDDTREYKRELDDKKISLEDYNAFVKAAQKKLNEDMDEVDNKRKEKALADSSETADLKVQGDEINNIGRKHISRGRRKNLMNDELSADRAKEKEEYQKTLDDANHTQADLDNITLKHAQNRLKIIKEAHLAQKKADLEAAKKGIDLAQKALGDHNKAIQQNLAAKNQILADDAAAQSALQQNGLTNSLDSIMKQQAKNLANSQAQARTAAAEQDYFNMGNQFIQWISGTAPGFEDGGPTGKGGNVDNKGGFLSVLHPEEYVVNKKMNKKYDGAAEAINNDKLEEWLLPKLNVKADISKAEQVNNAQLSLIAEKLDLLVAKKVIEPVYETERESVRIIHENGMTRTIVHHKAVMQPYKHPSL